MGLTALLLSWGRDLQARKVHIADCKAEQKSCITAIDHFAPSFGPNLLLYKEQGYNGTGTISVQRPIGRRNSSFNCAAYFFLAAPLFVSSPCVLIRVKES